MAKPTSKQTSRPPMTSTSFNCKEIMRAAHFRAKWRVLTVGGAYRDWFPSAPVILITV